MASSHPTELVVVAIPSDNDYVWKVSSEDVPHMTLLYLGEVNWTPQQLSRVTDYVEHAASYLTQFGMDVEKRGKLGDKDADVLFFDKSYDYKKLVDFRHHLLVDREIQEAYLAADQFPQWTPHLTLGFPDNPAKPDKREHPGFSWVNFDRVALWTQDSAGPTFELSRRRYGDLEVAMSTLEHYGVKGMKWGQHKKASRPPAHEDAARVGAIKTSVKQHKTQRHVSNKDLQDAITRMNLEKQFSQLSGGIDKTRRQKATRFLIGVLATSGQQTVQQVASNQMKSRVEGAINNAAKR